MLCNYYDTSLNYVMTLSFFDDRVTGKLTLVVSRKKNQKNINLICLFLLLPPLDSRERQVLEGYRVSKASASQRHSGIFVIHFISSIIFNINLVIIIFIYTLPIYFLFHSLYMSIVHSRQIQMNW